MLMMDSEWTMSSWGKVATEVTKKYVNERYSYQGRERCILKSEYLFKIVLNSTVYIM